MSARNFSNHQADRKELTARENVPPELGTRNACLFGLYASLLFGVICIIVGAVELNRTLDDERGNGVVDVRFGSPVFQEIVPLLTNIVVTVLTECMGYIHMTALRWALGSRLTFNSNLRLFTVIKGGHFSFGYIANFIQALSLIVCYCASSLLFAVYLPEEACDSYINPDTCSEDPGTGALNPGALLALGFGLLVKGVIVLLQYRNVSVRTWSSTPLETAWGLFSADHIRRVEGRCMMGVHDWKEPSTPRPPMDKQRPAWSAHPEVRRVLIFLWTITAMGLLWFGAAAAVVNGNKDSSCPESELCDGDLQANWALVPDTENLSNTARILVGAFEEGKSNWNISGRNASILAGTFFIVLGFQSVVTMGLHCAELLVNISRDEDIWRTAATETGYRPVNAIKTVLRSRQTVLLLIAKPVVHWLFGLSITFYVGVGIVMRPPQIMYMTICLALVASFGTYLCFWKPKGPQPATYGHIQTLIDQVDHWSQNLFWGDKAECIREEGVRHAGTAPGREFVEQIRMDSWYAGLYD